MHNACFFSSKRLLAYTKRYSTCSTRFVPLPIWVLSWHLYSDSLLGLFYLVVTTDMFFHFWKEKQRLFFIQTLQRHYFVKLYNKIVNESCSHNLAASAFDNPLRWYCVEQEHVKNTRSRAFWENNLQSGDNLTSHLPQYVEMESAFLLTPV